MKALKYFIKECDSEYTNYYNKIYLYCKYNGIKLIEGVLYHLVTKYTKQAILNDLYTVAMKGVWEKELDPTLIQICRDGLFEGIEEMASFCTADIKHYFTEDIYYDIADIAVNKFRKNPEISIMDTLNEGNKDIVITVLRYIGKFIINLELEDENT